MADPDILTWAQREDRILVSFDRNSLPLHLSNHLAAGGHSPGLFLVRRPITIPEIISALTLYAHASEPDEWRDQIEYIG
jgi:hypothetical protein